MTTESVTAASMASTTETSTLTSTVECSGVWIGTVEFGQFEKGDLSTGNVQVVREETLDASNALLRGAGKPEAAHVQCGKIRYGSILVDLYASPAMPDEVRREISALIAQAIAAQTFVAAGQVPSAYADAKATTTATRKSASTAAAAPTDAGAGDGTGASESGVSFRQTGLAIAAGLLGVLLLSLVLMFVLRLFKQPEIKHPWEGIPGWRMEGGMAHRGNYMDPVPPAFVGDAGHKASVGVLINAMSDWGADADAANADAGSGTRTGGLAKNGSAHYYPGRRTQTLEDYQGLAGATVNERPRTARRGEDEEARAWAAHDPPQPPQFDGPWGGGRSVSRPGSPGVTRQFPSHIPAMGI